MTLKFNAPQMFLLLIATFILLGLYSASMLAPSTHAVETHGYTASEIVHCISNNGTYMHMAFRSKDNKFYLPCQMPDGQIGLGIFDSNGNNITAFVPKDGVWNNVRDYILRNAVKFSGKIPFLPQ